MKGFSANYKLSVHTAKNGRRTYRATWWEPGNKHRSKSFPSDEERRRWLILRERSARDEAAVRASAARSGDYVARFAKLPQEVQNALLGAWDRLNGAGGDAADVVEAAEARARAMGGGVTVSEAVAAYLEDARDRVRPRTLKDLHFYLKPLETAYGGLTLHGLSRGRCREWIEAGATGNVRRHRHACLSALLNECIRRDWLQDSPMRGLKKAPEPRAERVAIFSAEEAERLLRTAERVCPRIVPHFALGLFAGLRPQRETAFVTEEFLNLEAGVLYVPQYASKTRVSRDVPVSPNLRAWLEAYPPERPVFYTRESRQGVCRVAKLGWAQDILRHTRASFRLAQVRDAARVADEMGNSVPVLKSHYANRVIPPEDVERFWSILPAGREITYALEEERMFMPQDRGGRGRR